MSFFTDRPRRLRSLFPPAMSVAFALTLIAPSAAQEAFPVTLTHAFGETVIEERPERIFTIGWMSQDAVVALGGVPVGVQFQGWGGNADGYVPWVVEALEARGVPLPPIIRRSGGIPFEQILALEPDLILAPYSGFSAQDYERLSAIAPTVAHVGEPFTGSWQYVIETAGAAMGEAGAARELIGRTEALLASYRDNHPEFAGTTFVFGSIDRSAGTLNAYLPHDPRTHLMRDLGLVPAPALFELPGDLGYVSPISFDQLDTIEADLLLTWHDNAEDLEWAVNHPLVSRYGPVIEGRHVGIVGTTFAFAISAPSALSIPWAMDILVPLIAEVIE